MYQLHICQEFEASAARLFKAWTHPALMSRWLAPGDLKATEVSADTAIGGQYRVVMEQPDGEQHIVTGHYIDVIENQKLVFSWQWQHAECASRVELRFTALSDTRCQLDLIHREFADEELRDKHQQGWEGCLSKLQQLLAQ
ncbi:SRPBCC family protein [Marinobacterium jannaschii]|uniref:SRPBCC family protein n=1 Tax=Marinobacterium jannaschii TaxID=64970 RepID=UPI000685713A|nr:SRPBCC domain-containing protein [Marinobacterium jannaschii]